jgi:hypothetical protein
VSCYGSFDNFSVAKSFVGFIVLDLKVIFDSINLYIHINSFLQILDIPRTAAYPAVAPCEARMLAAADAGRQQGSAGGGASARGTYPVLGARTSRVARTPRPLVAGILFIGWAAASSPVAEAAFDARRACLLFFFLFPPEEAN